MNYCGLMRSDIANGSGIRVTLWCAGCSIHCKGCQNPETWNFDSGNPLSTEVIDKITQELEKPYVKGITLTGGNPLEPENIQSVKHIVNIVKMVAPTKDVWLYTGRTLELKDFISGIYSGTLSLCDFVVDGAYVESQRDITLAFRGSANQRIIDVQKTLESKKIVVADID